ncbi:hypothetical protein OPT61_g1367 [Boeremia exigua]|uniref:Uncharacterized protein n=1 Tax=Boeremia exigua TaxID=749465 RepID=A0ACC2IQS3_9PLEO|nr:hypothetical protein OPT61_g1367 [Boeremia exigua]
MSLTTRPVSNEDWKSHLTVGISKLRELTEIDTPKEELHPFYIPSNIKHLISLHKPDEQLFKFLEILRGLYLSQVLAPALIFEGPLSDLRTKDEYEVALTMHIRNHVESEDSGATDRDTIVRDLVMALGEELRDLQQTQMTPAAINNFDITPIMIICDLYFLSCTIHPEVDLDGSNADWIQNLFYQQPTYYELDHTTPTDADEELPGLTQCLHHSFSFEGEDFVWILDLFGNWALIAIRDCLQGYRPRDALDDDESFTDEALHDLQNPLSLVPLHIREIICGINIQHAYRAICDQVSTVYYSDPSVDRVDVLGYRLFHWILTCVMRSNLQPEYKSRIQEWMERSGLDGELSMQYPAGVLIPGQRMLNRLTVESGPLEIPAYDDDEEQQEELDGFQDVEFEPEGPPLDPALYADCISSSDDHDEEVCAVCIDNIAHDQQDRMKIRACNHMIHEGCMSQLINGIDEWSNKCPVCRRRICPPRAKRAVTEEDLETHQVEDSGDIEIQEEEFEAEDEEVLGAEEIAVWLGLQCIMERSTS